MISIPEPCNEDFSKMTPTERGAFCSKCQIDTFDFRDLSDTKINQILLKNQGQHLCGQFTNRQLDSLNTGFVNWKNQRKETFRSKFVLALVLVFGLSLFSCNTQEQRNILELQSIELAATEKTVKTYINEIAAEEKLNLIDFLEEEVNQEVTCEIPVPRMVEIDATEELLDMPKEQYVTAGVPTVSTYRGGISVQAVTYYEYLEDTIKEPEILEPVQDETLVHFDATVFPNPTKVDATLALNIAVEGQFEIELFNMSGQLIRTVHSGQLSVGRQNFQIELAQENSGMYIVRVVSENQNESYKIQKVN